MSSFPNHTLSGQKVWGVGKLLLERKKVSSALLGYLLSAIVCGKRAFLKNTHETDSSFDLGLFLQSLGELEKKMRVAISFSLRPSQSKNNGQLFDDNFSKGQLFDDHPNLKAMCNCLIFPETIPISPKGFITNGWLKISQKGISLAVIAIRISFLLKSHIQA